jgi:hypothetical protein
MQALQRSRLQQEAEGRAAREAELLGRVQAEADARAAAERARAATVEMCNKLQVCT